MGSWASYSVETRSWTGGRLDSTDEPLIQGVVSCLDSVDEPLIQGVLSCRLRTEVEDTYPTLNLYQRLLPSVNFYSGSLTED